MRLWRLLNLLHAAKMILLLHKLALQKHYQKATLVTSVAFLHMGRPNQDDG